MADVKDGHIFASPEVAFGNRSSLVLDRQKKVTKIHHFAVEIVVEVVKGRFGNSSS